MGGNNAHGEPLNLEENICKVCLRRFSGHGIRSLGGQVACSQSCADRLIPEFPRDRCYGCDQIVWEFSYLILRDRHIFCNLECLTRFLSTEKPERVKCKSPYLKKRKLLLEKVLPGQITNKIPGMVVKYEKKRNKSK